MRRSNGSKRDEHPTAPHEVGRLRISVQYRVKHGNVFELTDGATVLTVQISPRQSSEDSGEWHVESRLGAGAGPALVDEWGDTPAEALGKTAATWAARIPALAPFNWDGIRSALHAVNAV